MDLALSGDQLSSRSGVDAATISRTENGISQVTLDSAIRICRALSISLSDLVAGLSANTAPSKAAGANAVEVVAPRDLSGQDAIALHKLFKISSSAGKELLAYWANSIMEGLSASGQSTQAFTLSNRDIDVILSTNPAFRFKVRYPEGDRLWAIQTIYRLGGELGQGDISLLLLAITDEPSLYQPLDEKNRELLRRLHSGTPDRVRLVEVMTLQELLKLDFLGMYDSVEGLVQKHKSTTQARVISLFVALCSWLRSLDKGDSQWLATVRRDIELKQQEFEKASGVPGRL